jgi:DNA-binding response OmpR family regulator
MEAARGRSAISFPLVNLDSGTTERRPDLPRAGCDQALPTVARARPHLDNGEGQLHVGSSDKVLFRRDRRAARAMLALLPPAALFAAIVSPGIISRLSMATPRRILIVDDDAELRDALMEQLSLHDEFEAVAVESGAKGVQSVKGGVVDLVIMDVGLPDIDGREAVRILRRNGFKAPIIMLTGHDTDSDTILGLESGANDYVAKPFRFAVLLARIRAQLRQHEASEDAVFAIGPYSFQPSSKLLLSAKGNKVRLTEKETAILRFLYRAGQRPISREILLQEVWGYNSGVTTHTLETHIYRLRQKIEKDAAIPEILVTEGGGYKLVP